MKRNSDAILQLRINVIKEFGQQINTATDCENLSALIFDQCNSKIAGQTLRRFFGLIKSTSGTSAFTLNLLSKFCGFRDWDDFSKSYCSSEVAQFFGSSSNSEKNYWEKSEQLCRQICESPEMLVSTHHRLMSYPLARKYFIENHPMRDMLGSVYTEYFSAYLKYNHSNEAKIFAYGFLFKSVFMSQNFELMDLYYRKLCEIPLTDEVYVIPAGLKFGVQLLYADFIGNESLFQSNFKEMKAVRLRYQEASTRSVCSFEYSVMELLIFTDRVNELDFLMQHNTVQLHQTNGYVPADRKATHDEVWKILSAVTHQKLGNTAHAKSVLAEVNLENLGFGWKKYYALIYYVTLYELVDDVEKAAVFSELSSLLQSTHFSYFEDRFSRIADKPNNTVKKIQKAQLSYNGKE